MMDVAAILALITKVISVANVAISAGEDAAPFIQKAYNLLSKPQDQITQQDLDQLEKEVDDLSEELNLPLPEDDGTTST